MNKAVPYAILAEDHWLTAQIQAHLVCAEYMLAHAPMLLTEAETALYENYIAANQHQPEFVTALKKLKQQDPDLYAETQANAVIDAKAKIEAKLAETSELDPAFVAYHEREKVDAMPKNRIQKILARFEDPLTSFQHDLKRRDSWTIVPEMSEGELSRASIKQGR